MDTEGIDQLINSRLESLNIKNGLEIPIKDLTLESIDFVDLVFEIEEGFGVDVELEDVNRDESIRELIDRLKREIAEGYRKV